MKSFKAEIHRILKEDNDNYSKWDSLLVLFQSAPDSALNKTFQHIKNVLFSLRHMDDRISNAGISGYFADMEFADIAHELEYLKDVSPTNFYPIVQRALSKIPTDSRENIDKWLREDYATNYNLEELTQKYFDHKNYLEDDILSWLEKKI